LYRKTLAKCQSPTLKVLLNVKRTHEIQPKINTRRRRKKKKKKKKKKTMMSTKEVTYACYERKMLS
jgi:hypothetical protein